VIEIQNEYHEELQEQIAAEPTPAPAPTQDWDLEAWDIYAIAADEFGMRDEDGEPNTTPLYPGPTVLACSLPDVAW